jgi:hypothetical protein
MTWNHALGAALVVGLIGPLFWLGVNVLDGKITALLREQIRKRKARASARQLRGP